MNHTLKTLLEREPRDFREAFYIAREECRTPQAKAEYDREMERQLLDKKRDEVCTDVPEPRDTKDRKRVEHMATK